MKKIIAIVLILIASALDNYSSESQGSKVYVCTGTRSQCYHRVETCRGLESCRGEIRLVTLKAAQSLGRRECKMCYKKK